MGEWSEYFEDFPEEDPANYVGNRFDPRGAAELRAKAARLAMEQAKLDAEISQIIQKHSRPAKQVRKEGESLASCSPAERVDDHRLPASKT